jgi:hypothetical protein
MIYNPKEGWDTGLINCSLDIKNTLLELINSGDIKKTLFLHHGDDSGIYGLAQIIEFLKKQDISAIKYNNKGELSSKGSPAYCFFSYENTSKAVATSNMYHPKVLFVVDAEPHSLDSILCKETEKVIVLGHHPEREDVEELSDNVEITYINQKNYNINLGKKERSPPLNLPLTLALGKKKVAKKRVTWDKDDWKIPLLGYLGLAGYGFINYANHIIRGYDPLWFIYPIKGQMRSSTASFIRQSKIFFSDRFENSSDLVKILNTGNSFSELNKKVKEKYYSLEQKYEDSIMDSYRRCEKSNDNLVLFFPIKGFEQLKAHIFNIKNEVNSCGRHPNIFVFLNENETAKYKVSLRSKSEKYNLGVITKECHELAEIPEERRDFGGHTTSSGAVFYEKKDYKKFKNIIMNFFSKKDVSELIQDNHDEPEASQLTLQDF